MRALAYVIDGYLTSTGSMALSYDGSLTSVSTYFVFVLLFISPLVATRHGVKAFGVVGLFYD